MRLPAPAALLLEHPAVPDPMLEADAAESDPTGEPVQLTDLTRADRYRLAVQLTAAASLLADCDLWPGRKALREARFSRTADGLCATLSRFPVALSRVFALHGGGQAAAESTRESVMMAISTAVDLPVSAIDIEHGEPGYFLDGALDRQLRELPVPLDPVTARSLWALRWNGLPIPEPGVAAFWGVPMTSVARRLASALWAALNRMGTTSLLRPGGSGDLESRIPESGGEGILVVAGSISSGDLAAISRWAGRPRCAAVAVGRFPPGWHPPIAPGFDAAKLSRHLMVTGTAIDRARMVVEQRVNRFDPLDRSDREALTRSAGYRFRDPPRTESAVRSRSSADRLEEVLSLAPDGLPPGFLSVHSGLSASEIEQSAKVLNLIASESGWRLPDVRLLETDPIHREIAKLFPASDPHRLLHHALGGGDRTPLVEWLRSRLDDLDGTAVRDLLALIVPGALGTEVQALMAEGCLSILDLTGARSSIAVLEGPHKRVFNRWLDVLDRAPAAHPGLPAETERKLQPRAAAEVSLGALRHALLGRGEEPEVVGHLIDSLLPFLSDNLRRHIEIERAFIEEPTRLEDRAWRRRTANHHPILRGRVMHRLAYRWMDSAPRMSRRVFRRLLVDGLGPGFSGVLELDTGVAAISEGASRMAEIHQLRAYRLLQAAGFQHATRTVLFNLGVTDLDQLRIGSALNRLMALAEDEPKSPYLLGELCRLDLAVGDEAAFKTSLSAFSEKVPDDTQVFEEGLQFLRGVSHLFDGDLRASRRALECGGQEGTVWLELVNALSRQTVGPLEPEGWGVGLAAGWIDKRSTPISLDEVSLKESFGLALVDRFAGAKLQINPATRARAIRALTSGGLKGWADQLRGGFGISIVPALATIVEQGSFEGVGEDRRVGLLQALGLTGLEIIDSRDGRSIWKIGSGPPGSEVRRGRISVVPFGGEAATTSDWTLATALFDLFAPATIDFRDPKVEETGFVGSSPAAVEVRRQLHALGPSHLPILILGETGVGKEIAARALHRLSGREGSFIAVDMNAIPSGLLEAELFGSLKGAFTGSDRSRRGLVAAAEGGTLFLDEIGDLDPPIQVKLLRFLESQEIRPVGSDQTTQVDVRIVSATHRDLKRRVRENVFRHDLFYRLGGSTLSIPPLRERLEDVSDLRDHFERLAVMRHGLRSARWSAEAIHALEHSRWPGNARELRHVIEVALVRAAGGPVRLDHLPIESGGESSTTTWEEAQREFRSRFLESALHRNGGNRSATARELGISRQALLYHLRNLGLTNILKN